MLYSWLGEERSRAERQDVTSLSVGQYIIRLREARRNCLNLKGVIAIKLVAAPRYHLRPFAPRCGTCWVCTSVCGSMHSPFHLSPQTTRGRLARVNSYIPLNAQPGEWNGDRADSSRSPVSD